MIRSTAFVSLVIVSLAPIGVLAEEPHSFLCADSGLRKLLIFSEKGEVTWEHEGVYCYDAHLLENGNVLFCDQRKSHGFVKEMTKDKEVVFEHKVIGEAFSCQRLENGNTLVGCCTAGQLEVVNPAGEVVKAIELQSEAKGHGTMRWARVTPWGTYLVAHIVDKAVREYNDQSEVVREIEAPDLAFGVVPLANKNILISTETAIIEVAPDDEVVWTLTGEDIPEAGAAWFAGIYRLPNGNTLVCNWLGHGKEGTGWPLFEVTPEKQIVWKFTDTERTKWIASAQLLE